MFKNSRQRRLYLFISVVFVITLCITQVAAVDANRQGVVILLESRKKLKLLKKYPLEIVRIRPVENSGVPTNKLHRAIVIEAIASEKTINRLKRDGFILKYPPKKETSLPQATSP